MYAIIRKRYGGPEVLVWNKVPSRPAATDEVRLRVSAASINAADAHMMRGTPTIMRVVFGLRRPRNERLGMAVAGDVVEVGDGVDHLVVGMRVYADLSAQAFCSFSEEVTVKANAVAPAPASLSAAEAAALPLAAVTALQAARKARIEGGDRVLVTGASGGVGTYLVQLAKLKGAHVTAVTSTPHTSSVASLGPDTVIDRKLDDFRSGQAVYDAVIECGGFGSVRAAMRTLRPGGRYVLVGGGNGQLATAVLMGKVFLATASTADLAEVGALAANGSLKPMLGATMPMNRAAEAMRLFESGSVAGKVVLENRY